MTNPKFAVGTIVEFNVGKPDGPVMNGQVTSVRTDGSFVISPSQPAQLTSNVRFFNIRRKEAKS